MASKDIRLQPALDDSDDDEDLGDGGFDLSKPPVDDEMDDASDASEDAELLGIGKRRRGSTAVVKKKRKRAHLSLIDDMAQEDSDEEDTERSNAREARDHWDDDLEAEMKRQDQRRQNLGVQDDEEFLQYVKERNRQEARRQQQYAAGGSMVASEVTRVQPTIRDRLYMVKCEPGKEAEAAVSLMYKLRSPAFARSPVNTITANGSSGVVYIECRDEAAVKQLIRGMRLLREYTMRMVPVSDLTAIMSVKSGKVRKALKRGAWVRMKRKGDYKGDLGKVVAVTQGGSHAVVQLEPRVDYTSIGLSTTDLRSRQRQRPPQKLFDAHLVHEQGGTVLNNRFPDYRAIANWPDAMSTFEVFEGNYYLRGYLFKEVNIEAYLDTLNIVPTIDELQRFQKVQHDESGLADEDTGDSKSMASVMKEAAKAIASATINKMPFFRGDTVQVSKGENAGLVGRVISVDTIQRIVRLQLFDLPGQEMVANKNIDFSVDELRKFMVEGAHVKVTSGLHAGETGFVSKINHENDTAFIRTDLTPKEIEVRLVDLIETDEVAQGLNNLMGYRLYDLVKLSEANVAGVIIQVGREDLRVLDTHGTERSVKPAQLQGKLNRQSQRDRAFDVDSRDVTIDKTVTVIEGQYKKMDFKVKHIYKSYLFLHSRHRMECAGIVVVRAKMVRLAGIKSSASNFSDNYMGLDKRDGRGGGAMGGKAAMMSLFKDALCGKTVRIKRGKYKGLIGIARSATDTHVKVELHAKHKTETIPRALVVEVTEQRAVPKDATLSYMENPAVTPGGTHTAATPAHIPATPGLHTPSHNMTPMHQATPTADSGVWEPGVGDTPLVDYSAVSPGATPLTDGGYSDGSGYSSNMHAHASPYSATSATSQSPMYSHSPYEPMAQDPSMPSTYSSNIAVTAAPGTGLSSDGPQLLGTTTDTAWCHTQVECTITATGEVCKVVRLVSEGVVVVCMREDSSERQVNMTELQPVTPQKEDKVISHTTDEEEDKGKVGVLINVSDSDGIVRVTYTDNPDDWELYPLEMRFLAKLADCDDDDDDDDGAAAREVRQGSKEKSAYASRLGDSGRRRRANPKQNSSSNNDAQSKTHSHGPGHTAKDEYMAHGN